MSHSCHRTVGGVVTRFSRDRVAVGRKCPPRGKGESATHILTRVGAERSETRGVNGGPRRAAKHVRENSRSPNVEPSNPNNSFYFVSDAYFVNPIRPPAGLPETIDRYRVCLHIDPPAGVADNAVFSRVKKKNQAAFLQTNENCDRTWC